MTDSILTTIKKMLGISEEYEHFDIDIITHINSTFSILAQLGVGPDKGFSVHDKTEKWSDYMPENATLEMVKTYVQLKVRMCLILHRVTRCWNHLIELYANLSFD